MIKVEYFVDILFLQKRTNTFYICSIDNGSCETS